MNVGAGTGIWAGPRIGWEEGRDGGSFEASFACVGAREGGKEGGGGLHSKWSAEDTFAHARTHRHASDGEQCRRTRREGAARGGGSACTCTKGWVSMHEAVVSSTPTRWRSSSTHLGDPRGGGQKHARRHHRHVSTSSSTSFSPGSTSESSSSSVSPSVLDKLCQGHDGEQGARETAAPTAVGVPVLPSAPTGRRALPPRPRVIQSHSSFPNRPPHHHHPTPSLHRATDCASSASLSVPVGRRGGADQVCARARRAHRRAIGGT